MVKITHEPVKELVIHQVSKVSIDEFTKEFAGRVERVFWSEGTIVFFMHYPDNDDIVKQAQEGKLHWSYVEYADMPDYKEVLKNGAMELLVTKADTNDAILEGVRFLKTL